jgi:hypothetical protein
MTSLFPKMEYAAAFKVLWELYPRKIGKVQAERSCIRLVQRGDANWEQLTSAAKFYADAMKAEGREERHILHASTFYGPMERWRDYILPPEAKDKSNLPNLNWSRK